MDPSEHMHPLPVDPDVLAMLADLQEPGEPDLLEELVVLFLRDTPERLAAIGDALAAGDLDGAARSAHSLKGSAANLGAGRLQDLAAIAESRARDGDASDTARVLAAMHQEFGLVRRQLDTHLASRPRQ